MPILVNESTSVIVQGITGAAGIRHARLNLEYGTRIVAGVTPGKGGRFVDVNIPVFDTVRDAVNETQATASIIFVPPHTALSAVCEAVDARLELVVCVTEGVPMSDLLRINRLASLSGVRLLGPGSPGVITPGSATHAGCSMGIMPQGIFSHGNIGVVTRSGTLGYEAAWNLSSAGFGQTTWVGVGGGSICGLRIVDVVKMFNADSATDGIVIIGEIGGTQEEEAARWIRHNCRKPIVGYIAGSVSPGQRRMGHAPALTGNPLRNATDKMEAMREAGIHIATTPSAIPELFFTTPLLG